MNKRVLVYGATAILLLLGLLALRLWWSHKNPEKASIEAELREAMQKRAAAQMDDAPRWVPQKFEGSIKLALGALGFEDERIEGELEDLLLSQLSDEGIELMERKKLDLILKEAALTRTAMFDGKEITRLGELLGVDFFLFGRQIHTGNESVRAYRLVEARSGVIRDLTVIPSSEGDPVVVADLLTHFVINQREGAQHQGEKVFLAIGFFKDMSLNRLADRFGEQIHGFLSHSFKNTEIMVLERELIGTLMKEARMSLAGLSEPVDFPPLQSAFWIVDGFYQTYQDDGVKIDLSLTVEKVFAGKWRRSIKGEINDELFDTIKEVVTQIMADSKVKTASALFARRSEVGALFNQAKELSGLRFFGNSPYFGNEYNEPWKVQEDIQRSVEALETVLLLEPDHSEAKLYLGMVLAHSAIQRYEDSDQVLWEIISSEKEETLVHKAKVALVQFYAHYGNWRNLSEEEIKRAGEWCDRFEAETSEVERKNDFQRLRKVLND